ncbi:hypothetical protein BpHYR1_023303 [Brachionus plicatilis]|uniref:Uncharacterized protein n=1 Tax=Brachionus plicatilis TaxID=10195 RepID=A0A3M7Q9L6_BRAPC|nr:hypothetical protein BpHYR1_023303 [Brachionus plicatilis]
MFGLAKEHCSENCSVPAIKV